MGKKVLFRITLDAERDGDVVEALKKCPKTLRGEYVATAVRYMRKGILSPEKNLEENISEDDSKEPDLDFGLFFK